MKKIFHPTLSKFIHYEIQIGKGKGSYKTKYTLTNQFEAIKYYRGINIGNGYKKRFVEVYDDGKNVVFRQFS
jgi:hypothetical protein